MEAETEKARLQQMSDEDLKAIVKLSSGEVFPGMDEFMAEQTMRREVKNSGKVS